MGCSSLLLQTTGPSHPLEFLFPAVRTDPELGFFFASSESVGFPVPDVIVEWFISPSFSPLPWGTFSPDRTHGTSRTVSGLSQAVSIPNPSWLMISPPCLDHDSLSRGLLCHLLVVLLECYFRVMLSLAVPPPSPVMAGLSVFFSYLTYFED